MISNGELSAFADPLRQLVAEAALGLRKCWTLDRTYECGDATYRRLSAAARADFLASQGYETRILEEEDTEAIYVWRRG